MMSQVTRGTGVVVFNPNPRPALLRALNQELSTYLVR